MDKETAKQEVEKLIQTFKDQKNSDEFTTP